MWVELGVLAIAMYASHRTGIARGRYGDKKQFLSTFKACSCGHSITVHAGKHGTGGCDREWRDNGVEKFCQCKRFTPNAEGDDDE